MDGEDLTKETGWRRLREQYFGNVKILDDAVGKLLKALEDTGQMEHTIFAFTSDHGDMAGDHNMFEKRTFYEGSARVPMLLSVPWLTTQQKRIGGVFGHADLIPTLLELAGQELPDSLPGTSVVNVLNGEKDLNGHVTFMEWNGVGKNKGEKAIGISGRVGGNSLIYALSTLPWRCMVSGDRWKLNLCSVDQCELFDLNNDPFEEENLFNESAHRDRVREMAARIRLWQHETGDTADLPAV